MVGHFGWNESEVPSRVREALVLELLHSTGCPKSKLRAFGESRWELLELMGRYDGAAIRMSTEKLDRELATEVKRTAAK